MNLASLRQLPVCRFLPTPMVLVACHLATETNESCFAASIHAPVSPLEEELESSFTSGRERLSMDSGSQDGSPGSTAAGAIRAESNTSKHHKCPLCPKTYSRLSRLRDHENIHQGLKPHICAGRCGVQGWYVSKTTSRYHN